MDILCKRLKQLREEKNLTQEDIGAIIGVQKGAVSYYESGRNMPSIEDLTKIADEYNKSLDYFAGRDYYIINDSGEDYGKSIRMSKEEVRFIKELRKDMRLHSDLIENPENLVNRMKIKL